MYCVQSKLLSHVMLEKNDDERASFHSPPPMRETTTTTRQQQLEGLQLVSTIIRVNYE